VKAEISMGGFVLSVVVGGFKALEVEDASFLDCWICRETSRL
jgi:hypothetical protein